MKFVRQYHPDNNRDPLQDARIERGPLRCGARSAETFLRVRPFLGRRTFPRKRRWRVITSELLHLAIARAGDYMRSHERATTCDRMSGSLHRERIAEAALRAARVGPYGAGAIRRASPPRRS